MNVKYIFSVLATALLFGLTACEKETTPERIVLKETMPKVGTDAYYANLRAYKKSDHAVAFGWWGGSGGAPNSDMSTRFIALPDSMDIVSLWGGLPKDQKAWEEMRYCQRVKGTRFVNVIFGSGVDGLMRKNFPELSQNDVMSAIDSVAKSINDTVLKYKLDGFDLDYEPNYGDGGIFGHGPRDEGGDVYTQRLFKALSKYMGPKSDSGLLLIIDGENEKGIIPYIDYLAQQVYDCGSPSNAEWKYNNYGFYGALPSKKFIATENMEKYGGLGQPDFTIFGKKVGSVLGMALWNPKAGRKGGFGGYLIEKDYYSKPNHPYYYIRLGIQLQNPSVK